MIDRYMTAGGTMVTISRNAPDLTDDQIDDLDLDALVADAESDAAAAEFWVSRFNMVHAPAGSPAGGQFAASGGGGTAAAKGGHAAEKKRLHERAKSLRHQADLLAQALKGLLAQLHHHAAASKKAKQQGKSAAAGAKAAASHAKHPNRAQHHKRKQAASHHHKTARHHTRVAVGLARRISTMRTKIKDLRAEAAQLDKKAAAL